MQNKLRRSGAEIFLNARIWDKLLHINLLEDKVELTDAEIETMGQSQMKCWICHEISRMLNVSSEKTISY